MALPTTQYLAPLHHNTPIRRPAQETFPQPAQWAHKTSGQITVNTTPRHQVGHTNSNTAESPRPGHAGELILCHHRGQKSAAAMNNLPTGVPAPTSLLSLSTWEETPAPKWCSTHQTPLLRWGICTVTPKGTYRSGKKISPWSSAHTISTTSVLASSVFDPYKMLCALPWTTRSALH